MIMEANSAKIKKEILGVKIGDIIWTSVGHAKIARLNPIQVTSIIRRGGGEYN